MHIQTHKTKSKSKPQQLVKLTCYRNSRAGISTSKAKAILKFNCLADVADREQEPKRGKERGRVGRGENERGGMGKQMNCALIQGKK